jgi:hypothetical protein
MSTTVTVARELISEETLDIAAPMIVAMIRPTMPAGR